MKFSEGLLKEAHKLTKEIKKEYPEINYSFQFGLEMKYLLSNKEGENMDKANVVKKFLEENIRNLTRPTKPELLKKRLENLEEANITNEKLEKAVTINDALNIIIAENTSLKGIISRIMIDMSTKLLKIYIVPEKDLVTIEIPVWLAEKSGLSTTVKALITKETEKAIQVNYETWLPKSKITY